MNITFTGIDSQTNLFLLPKDIEYGILYTDKPELQSNKNRYPTLSEIELIADNLSKNGYKLSLHVCGKPARIKLINKELDFINKFNRIQVNGKLKTEEVELICSLYPFHTIITQHHNGNVDLLNIMNTNHSILIDSSGGYGLSPKEWIAPTTNKLVGFAGGLSPDNIFREFEKIKPISKNGFWLDLEGKLRNKEDLFDIDLATNMANKYNIIYNLKD